MGGGGAAEQRTPRSLLQTTGIRGPLHCYTSSDVRCNVFCSVLSVFCCGVVRCPLHVASCPLQRCLFHATCRRLSVARCQEPAVRCPSLVEHRTSCVQAALSVVGSGVACSVLFVVSCRLHAVGCMLHGVRYPLSVARRTSGFVATLSVATVAAVPCPPGAGPRLHFVAPRSIERGEVRYE